MKKTNPFVSRKFWFALLAIILTAFNDMMGEPLDEEAISNIVNTVLGYIGVQGVVDVTHVVKQTENKKEETE